MSAKQSFPSINKHNSFNFSIEFMKALKIPGCTAKREKAECCLLNRFVLLLLNRISSFLEI